MKLINRDKYMQKLIDVKGTPDIKVITGIRRAGKSKLMEEFIKYIENSETNVNIIHINYNIPTFDDIKQYKALYDYVSNKYDKSKKNYLFIDEVQMCDGFEKAINGFHAEEKYDIYITGSNAFLLSSDLATLFTGRTFSIQVYPFSFDEYMEYFNYTDIDKAFTNYLLDGGMSGSYLYKNQNDKYSYIREVYNTLIIRDITEKYKIRNVEVIQNLSNFLMDNISNLTSPNSITQELNKQNIDVTNKTIEKYIKYLCNSYAFYEVKRYDIRGKKYLSSQSKYYLCDQSFKYALLGTRNMDYGRSYENIVAIELLRRGYELYVGMLYNKEIDFVAIKQSEKLYIQVSDNISEEKTFNREIDSLLKINDAYPKILLANTKHETYQYEGVQIIDIAKWLINK